MVTCGNPITTSRGGVRTGRQLQGKLLGKNTFPTGTCSAGRRKELVQGLRTTAHAYVSDPEYGDESYDLLPDPLELNNVLSRRFPSEPGWCSDLRRRIENGKSSAHNSASS